MNSSFPGKPVTKPGLKRIANALLRLSLLSLAGVFLSACQVNAEDADTNDAAGVYTLVTVDGAKLPATVSHGDVAIKVRSGIFTINADGTCSSKVVFGPPSGAEFTREVKATYIREGSNLNMQWEGAGKTVGTIKGDNFAMDNEGIIFSYEKQPGDEVLDRFLGTWRSVLTQGQRAEENGTVDLAYSRVLGGKFVQELGKVAGENTAMIMFTYDTHENLYRAWRFAATDSPSESTGKWNPVSNTLEWTAVAKAGQEITMTSRHHFVNENVFDWGVVWKDSAGKILFEMEGKATRTSQSTK